jgi:hypothetical protein
VQEQEAWAVFWDAPFVVPGVGRFTAATGREAGHPPNFGPITNQMNLDLPRKESEIKRVQASYNSAGCTVKTDGSRIEVNFPGMTSGIFSGSIRFTAYRGGNLLRLEALATTKENMVAYKYDAGLKGLSTANLPHVTWVDTGGNAQQYRFGGVNHEGPVAVRAKNRIMVAEGAKGSIAVFPPPTVFFPTREVDTNLGFVWYRKDAEGRYSIGVKQADHEEDERYWYNYALYNAPPGTLQRMATYFYLSPASGEATRETVLKFTHGDTYKPLPGYKTLVNHFHIQFTDHLRELGSLDTETPDLAALRALGVNIVGLSDFHADHLDARGTGEKRTKDQHDYFDAASRASDKDFLVTPWEEPQDYLGAHYNMLTPKPYYYSRRRADGQPFIEQNPTYGKVYHPNNAADMQTMMDAENTYWFEAHPRTKSNSGYPDAIWDKPWAKNDRFLGLAFKPGMGMDLSEPTLCAWRCFDALDTMNNMYAGTGIMPKYAIADADTYQKFPHDDIFPGLPVNYIKLDKTPTTQESWAPILKSLRAGDFFVTTGEILIRNYAIQGTGDKRTLVFDVDWTFPMENIEIVSGDGKTVDHRNVRVTDLAPMSSKHFAIPFDAKGKKWVRVAVWDSAVNGAFVQAQWLNGTSPAR